MSPVEVGRNSEKLGLPTEDPRGRDWCPYNLWQRVERVGEKTWVRHDGTHKRGVRDGSSGLHEEIQHERVGVVGSSSSTDSHLYMTRPVTESRPAAVGVTHSSEGRGFSNGLSNVPLPLKFMTSFLLLPETLILLWNVDNRRSVQLAFFQ